MKISQKLMLSFFIIILLMAAFGYFTIIRINRISKISHEVREAMEYAEAILDFNVENFHTQLEVWEYVHEPNQSRLIAFENHNETLSKLLENITELIEEEYKEGVEKGEREEALFEGAEKQIEEISFNLEKVRTDWIVLFEKIKDLRSVKDAGYGEGSEQYEKIEKELSILALANEDLFDELDFNAKVDHFVVSQAGIVEKLNIELENLVSGSRSILIIIMGVLIVFGTGIAMFISRSISGSIIKLRDATNEIGKGKLDTRIEIKSKDEIGHLATSFNQMVTDLKGSMTSIDNLNEAQNKLESTNQQLAASERQLKVSNKQLMVNEQELKASNQQLMAANEKIEKSKKELEEKIFELERFQNVTIGRELEMVKLKKRINGLLEELGKPKEFTMSDNGEKQISGVLEG